MPSDLSNIHTIFAVDVYVDWLSSCDGQVVEQPREIELYQELSRQTKPKKGRFMNFSGGGVANLNLHFGHFLGAPREPRQLKW